MGKEKILGVLIFLVSIVVLVYYTWSLLLIQIFPDLALMAPVGLEWLLAPDWKWLVILPIWAGAVLIMVIAMWIGWTMMTTPAPEPLEDFDFDEEKIEPEAEKTE